MSDDTLTTWVLRASDAASLLSLGVSPVRTSDGSDQLYDTIRQAVRDELNETCVTLDEAVKLTGCNERTLREWAHSGKVKAWKVGREWRFRRGDLVGGDHG